MPYTIDVPYAASVCVWGISARPRIKTHGQTYIRDRERQPSSRVVLPKKNVHDGGASLLARCTGVDDPCDVSVVAPRQGDGADGVHDDDGVGVHGCYCLYLQSIAIVSTGRQDGIVRG